LREVFPFFRITTGKISVFIDMRKTAFLFVFIPFLFFSCTACSLPFGEENLPEELDIVSWNVQNLFDDVSDGGEYDEFNPDKGIWNSDLFYKRMYRMEEVFDSLFESRPHIILLQEIENHNTLDILNHKILKKEYAWQVLIEDDDQSVNTAVLSRIPVKAVATLETGFRGLRKLRPITEIHFDLSGRELVVFNNHWKSKSGGSAATEEGRISSALILTKRIKKLLAVNEQLMIIAAGDFNENHDEYKRTGRNYQTALIPDIEVVSEEWSDSLFVTSRPSRCTVQNDRLVLYSPWYDVSSSGSYAYKSQWNKIDHFFLWKSLFDGSGYDYESFRVVKDSLLLNDYNYPSRWDHITEEGYSDHLPIHLKLINRGN